MGFDSPPHLRYNLHFNLKIEMPKGGSIYDVRNIFGFFYPSPLVTVKNQLILFLLSAFWGPPGPPPPTHCGLPLSPHTLRTSHMEVPEPHRDPKCDCWTLSRSAWRPAWPRTSTSWSRSTPTGRPPSLSPTSPQTSWSRKITSSAQTSAPPSSL